MGHKAQQYFMAVPFKLKFYIKWCRLLLQNLTIFTTSFMLAPFPTCLTGVWSA